MIIKIRVKPTFLNHKHYNLNPTSYILTPNPSSLKSTHGILSLVNAEEMKVAIVHDWLTNMGGAERVVLALSDLYPDAPIYTSVYQPKAVPLFSNRDVRTSFLQKVPFVGKKHQLFPTLRPIAFESFDLSAYDVVISSASAEAKGVITKPDTCHICYCHTPTRYYWSDYHAYYNRLQFGLLNPFVKWSLPRMTKNMRMWDYAAAQRVDYFIANSQNTAARIQKYYHRDSEVIAPPVDTDAITPTNTPPRDYFLVVSRLVPYKRIDLVIEAFNELQLPLNIVGTGPALDGLKKLNTSPHTSFLEEVSEEEKIKLYQHCLAFLFPTEEDAGITPLEAASAGRPVIAYGKGGALETILPGLTGTFFTDQTAHALSNAIRHFDASHFSPHTIRKHAETFGTSVFQGKMRDYVKKTLEMHRAKNNRIIEQ